MTAARMAPRPLYAWAVVTCLATAPSLSAQQLARPHFLWLQRAGPESPFELPTAISGVASSARVFVTDVSRQRVLVLDAATGRELGRVGSKGAGPGEFSAPDLAAASPGGDLLVIYDLGAQSLNFFDDQLQFVTRRAVGPLVIWPKGLVLLDDSVAVIAGGVESSDDSVPTVHWSLAGTRRLASTAPYAEAEGESRALRARADARVYVAGGPLLRLGSSVRLADAATGDVWVLARDSARRLARGPGAPRDLGQRMIVVGTSPTHGRFIRPWWTFPRTALLDTLSGRGYLVGVTLQDSAIVRFYELREGGSPRLRGGIRLRARALAAYDATSGLVIAEDSTGELSVGRLAYPFRP